MTAKGLAVGQYILAINGKSLKGLTHKEVVQAIKSAFEGPMNKVIELTILIPTT